MDDNLALRDAAGTGSEPPGVFGRLATLGDSTRSRILALLERNELVVSEICHALQLPQSTVSRHLRILVAEGWAASRARGASRPYRLAALPPHARSLWALVREELERTGYLASDRERARSVLARRLERSRRFFSRSAEQWDALKRELYGQGAPLLPLFGLLEPGWTVGDLGAGTGELAALLAPFVRRVVAVDRSPEMLEAAGRRLAGTANVELREGDLDRLPLGDGELDLAVLSLVLHYVVEPPRALAEASRVLRPGGRLLLLDMRSHAREGYREEMGHLWPGFDPATLEGWLAGAGFEAATVRPLPPDPEAKGPLLLVAAARRPDRGSGGNRRSS